MAHALEARATRRRAQRVAHQEESLAFDDQRRWRPRRLRCAGHIPGRRGGAAILAPFDAPLGIADPTPNQPGPPWYFLESRALLLPSPVLCCLVWSAWWHPTSVNLEIVGF
jgi:hypothetical protein